MKKSKHLLIILLFSTWATIVIAHGSQQQLRQDTIGLRNQIDSVSSLKVKDFKKVVLLAAKAIEKARASNSNELLKSALYKGALLDWLDGLHPQALEKTYEYLVLSKRLQDTVGIANSHSLLGLIYLYTSDYDSSLFQFDKALLYYNVLQDTAQVIKNYGFKGLVFSLRGDYLRAKENLLSTVLLKRQHSIANLGVLNLSNDEKLTRKYYRESLIEAKENAQIIEETGDTSLVLRNSYHDIAISYLKLGLPDSALMKFKKSVSIAQSIGIDPYWNELSRAYSTLGFYDSAILCNKKAIENSRDHGTRISLATGYDVLGNSYKAKGAYQDALNSYKQELSLHTSMGHKYAKMNTMLSLSETLLKDNQLDEALTYTDSAIAIAHLIDTPKGLSAALLSRFTLLKLKGDYKKALDVKETYDVLFDSLQKGKVQLDLAKLDLYNDVELGKLKISELNKQQELSKANLKNQNLIIVIILIIGFFVTLLLLFNHFKTRKLGKLNTKLNKQQLIITNQNKDLTKSNREKELLLGEIHHRVKNNLQVISSLLSLQERNITDEAAKAAILDGKERVQSMGLIHKMLYQQNNFSGINMGDYIEKLISGLLDSFGKKSEDFELNYDIKDINLDVDTAIPLGLIINELVVNSLKHAYTLTKEPRINIDLKEINSQLVLKVEDNGVGEVSDVQSSQSFGMKLVNSLSRQLSGTIDMEQRDGLCFKIAINDYKLIA
jgi:two-component system, sensor histidine kinase PdtaS